MAVNRKETAKRFLAKEIEKLSEQERQVDERFIHRGRIARNVAHEFEEQLTAGQRLADRVAEIIGSWRFIIIQSMLLAVWITLNITAYIYRWDPYPFILLNLGAVIPGCLLRADHNDEPEPPIRERSPASEERLRGQPESRAGDHAVTRKVQRAARFLLGRSGAYATSAD